LVFYSSTITMMHGPINIRKKSFFLKRRLTGPGDAGDVGEKVEDWRPIRRLNYSAQRSDPYVSPQCHLPGRKGRLLRRR